MPDRRKDQEQRQAQNPLKAPMAGSGILDKDSPGGKLRDAPRGDYSKGHPGLPPNDYEAAKEKRR